MEPLISIQLFGHLPAYRPGDVLRCDYQIDAVDAEEVTAVEASVLWFTEGKGDEDLGIHFFERRVAAGGEGNLCELHHFQAPLPMSPLSYDGQIVRIRWCVRVRAFLNRNRESSLDYPFWLGSGPRRAVRA